MAEDNASRYDEYSKRTHFIESGVCQNDENGYHEADYPPAETSRSENRVACHFYKNNPAKWYNQCGHIVYQDVRRMQQYHLFVLHRIWICPTCGKSLQYKEDRKGHVGADPGCRFATRLPRDYSDGLDDDQLKMLRATYRANAENPEPEARWKHIYKISFPNVEEPDIPSPWFGEFDRRIMDAVISYLRTLANQRRTERSLPPNVAQFIGTVLNLYASRIPSELKPLPDNLLSLNGWVTDASIPSDTLASTQQPPEVQHALPNHLEFSSLMSYDITTAYDPNSTTNGLCHSSFTPPTVYDDLHGHTGEDFVLPPFEHNFEEAQESIDWTPDNILLNAKTKAPYPCETQK